MIFLSSYRYRLMISSFYGVCKDMFQPVHQQTITIKAITFVLSPVLGLLLGLLGFSGVGGVSGSSGTSVFSLKVIVCPLSSISLCSVTFFNSSGLLKLQSSLFFHEKRDINTPGSISLPFFYNSIIRFTVFPSHKLCFLRSFPVTM